MSTYNSPPSLPSPILPTNFNFTTLNTSNYQPPEPNQPQQKRPRLTPSPVEHTTLSTLKKLEREALRNSTTCDAHRSLISIPSNIINLLMSHGVAINRTNEAIEVLSGQVTTLSNQITPTPQTNSPQLLQNSPNPLLLSSYHTILTQTLNSIRTLSTLTTSPTTQSSTIRATVDSISKIRDLIMLQCNFDCYNDGLFELTNGFSGLMPISTSTSGVLRSGLGPSWGQVYAVVRDMEFNLRTYMEVVGVYYRRGQPHQTTQSSIKPLQPMHTSTPLSKLQILEITKKRKSDNDAAAYDNDTGNGSLFEMGSRRTKLCSRRVCFSFGESSHMDVDSEG